MEGQLAVPAENVLVEVSAQTEDGKDISQTYPLSVQKGSKDGQILAAAYGMFKQTGGILVDADNGDLLFYVGVRLKGPIRFTLKKVVLADATALPRTPQLN